MNDVKKLFTISFLFTISLFGFSQDLEFGLKAGATLGYFDNEGKDHDYGKPKLGLTIGGIGRFRVSDKFFMKSELGFSQIAISGEDSDCFNRLSRIELMLLAGYRISNKIDLEIGTEVNKVVKATASCFQPDNDITSLYRKLNAGVNLGANIRINETTGVNLRYSLGLFYYDAIQLIDENQNDIGKTERVSYLSLGVNYYLSN